MVLTSWDGLKNIFDIECEKNGKIQAKSTWKKKNKVTGGSRCEAAYKMKKSGRRESLVWEKMKKIKTK